MSKDYRCWVYHEEEDPKVVTKEEAEALYSEGWADSPAKFLKLESVGIDKDKVEAGDAEEVAKAQQTFDAVEGIKESLNGYLNIDVMDREELKAYAAEHFGLEFGKKRDATIRAELKALIEGA